MSSDVKLVKDDGVPYDDISSYHSLIGEPITLTNTRLDICFAINDLSQFLSKPMKAHYHVAIHILKYLKGSLGASLFFQADSKLQIKAFCDSN